MKNQIDNHIQDEEKKSKKYREILYWCSVVLIIILGAVDVNLRPIFWGFVVGYLLAKIR